MAPLDGPQPQPPAERCTEGMSGGETLSFNLCTCETGGASWSVPMCGSVRMRHGAGLARAGVCRRQHVRGHGMPGRWWRGALKGPPRSVPGPMAHGPEAVLGAACGVARCARVSCARSAGARLVAAWRTQRAAACGRGRAELARDADGGQLYGCSARRRSAVTRCGAAFSGLGAQCARPAATWHA